MHDVLARNSLTETQRNRILERVREGRSLRAIEAETGHRRETISRYAREAGLRRARETAARASR